MPVILTLFGVIIILAIAGSIFGHMDRKKTGRKQEESWHNVLIFELYFISLILILTQLGGDSRFGLNPDSGPFWILLFTASLSTFFAYHREKKMAEQ